MVVLEPISRSRFLLELEFVELDVFGMKWLGVECWQTPVNINVVNSLVQPVPSSKEPLRSRTMSGPEQQFLL